MNFASAFFSPVILQMQAYVKVCSYTLRTYTYKGYDSQGTCKLDGVACRHYVLFSYSNGLQGSKAFVL